MKFKLTIICLSITSFAMLAHAQLPRSKAMEDCPLHAQHQTEKTKRHLANVNRRGAQAMGFSQTRTTHRFLLKADGGTIEVTAKRANDRTSRNQIRQHLLKITRAFAIGDFSQPQHTHAQTPPGVTTMKELKAYLYYRYEPLPRGARVRIVTADSAALQAIHEFLRFQIEDHQTGDSTEVALK